MNLLFICSRNNWRSPTAEAIYKNNQGINVKSAGTKPSARIKVTAKLIDWADTIFVMEKRHKKSLTDKFPDHTSNKPIFTLDITDEYGYMDEEPIEIIKTSVATYLPYV